MGLGDVYKRQGLSVYTGPWRLDKSGRHEQILERLRVEHPSSARTLRPPCPPSRASDPRWAQFRLGELDWAGQPDRLPLHSEWVFFPLTPPLHLLCFPLFPHAAPHSNHLCHNANGNLLWRICTYVDPNGRENLFQSLRICPALQKLFPQ